MIKKLISLVIIIIAIFCTGCSYVVEDDKNILIQALPSTSTINVDQMGGLGNFNYTFKLLSDTQQVYLTSMKIVYYNDVAPITTRTYSGNYVILSGKGDEKIFPMNLVIPEINEVLKTDQIIRASIKFTFTSVTEVFVEIPSEITIVRLSQPTSSAIRR